jgi:hypothetical protein
VSGGGGTVVAFDECSTEGIILNERRGNDLLVNFVIELVIFANKVASIATSAVAKSAVGR